MERTIQTYALDELPLLYTIIKSLGIGNSVDEYIKVHGNWTGALPGTILELWLCYFLSECDHRLSGTEEWAKNNLDLLRLLSGNKGLSIQDFSDDKLGTLLDYFSEDAYWSSIETAINSKVLGVYRLTDLAEGADLATFRLDAAPMQGYGKVKENGLLQYGYHKHHANLPQFKLKLCTLDNSVNHFAYPICHLTVNGKVADDELYTAIIEESKKVLNGVPTLTSGNLYVGDSKFGSLNNRLAVHKNLDYYLMPLSKVQLTTKERKILIDNSKSSKSSSYEQVFKKEQGEKVLVAEGFEVYQNIEVDRENGIYQWTERRLFVHSVNYAKSQCTALEKRLSKASNSISELTERKQGKAILSTKEGYETAIAAILQVQKIENLLAVEVIEHQTKIKKRAYGNRPERVEINTSFELIITREENAIEQRKKYMGWQVYATNAPQSLLTFEKCVWKYRYQSNIESRFDDIRNKMAPLLPVFLQKENRIQGLVNILLLALKVCSILEYKVAKELQDRKEVLRGIYEGNPKRGTDCPSAKRILTAFKGISMSVILEKGKFQFALMTDLKLVQQKILTLLDLNDTVYTDLIAKIELFFSDSIIIET